jgi:hypothetical protein
MIEEKIKIRWKRSRRALEVASIVGGAVAVIGLLQEGLPSWGARLVWIGVLIEVFASFWVYGVSRRIEKFDAEELEEMRLKTAEAGKSLESERLARLTLEQTLAPRRLFGDAAKRIISKLKLREPDEPVPIFICRHDSEMMRFADDLGSVLQLANWNVAGGGVKSYDRVMIGVWIETSQTVSSKEEDRAYLLEEVFQAEGIRVEQHKIRTTPSFTTAPESALGRPIQILVGEKP